MSASYLDNSSIRSFNPMSILSQMNEVAITVGCPLFLLTDVDVVLLDEEATELTTG